MFLALLMLALTAASPAAGCPVHGKPALTVQRSPARTVRVWTSVRGGDEPMGVALLCDDRGRRLDRIEMPQANAGEVTARTVSLPGWPSPVVALVSTYSRADGISADPILWTTSHGRPRTILDRHLDWSEALCIGRLSPSSPAALAVIEFLSAGECHPCWPKLYRAKLYAWRGNALRLLSTRTTRRRHPDWRSALRELCLACPQEILHAGEGG